MFTAVFKSETILLFYFRKDVFFICFLLYWKKRTPSQDALVITTTLGQPLQVHRQKCKEALRASRKTPSFVSNTSYHHSWRYEDSPHLTCFISVPIESPRLSAVLFYIPCGSVDSFNPLRSIAV